MEKAGERNCFNSTPFLLREIFLFRSEPLLKQCIQNWKSMEMIKLLIEHVTRLQKSPTISKSLFQFSYALQLGRIDIIKFLVEEKQFDVNLDNPFSIACLSGNLDLVKYFVSKGVEVSILNVQNESPFFLAMKEGNFEIVKFLIETQLDRIDINFPNINQETPLSIACFHGHEENVKYFLDFCVAKNRKIDLEFPNNHGETALLYASYRGNLDIFKNLIEAGADFLHVRNRGGENAMGVAISFSRIEIVKYLVLEKNVDLNMHVNNRNETALCMAAADGASEIAKFLISTKKVDLNAQNKYKETPVSVAAYRGALDIVKELFEAGADILIPDERGRTPLELALYNRTEVADYLKEKIDGMNLNHLHSVKQGEKKKKVKKIEKKEKTEKTEKKKRIVDDEDFAIK